jgi:hypothetical protein
MRRGIGWRVSGLQLVPYFELIPYGEEVVRPRAVSRALATLLWV